MEKPKNAFLPADPVTKICYLFLGSKFFLSLRPSLIFPAEWEIPHQGGHTFGIGAGRGAGAGSSCLRAEGGRSGRARARGGVRRGPSGVSFIPSWGRAPRVAQTPYPGKSALAPGLLIAWSHLPLPVFRGRVTLSFPVLSSFPQR